MESENHKSLFWRRMGNFLQAQLYWPKWYVFLVKKGQFHIWCTDVLDQSSTNLDTLDLALANDSLWIVHFMRKIQFYCSYTIFLSYICTHTSFPFITKNIKSQPGATLVTLSINRFFSHALMALDAFYQIFSSDAKYSMVCAFSC